jgi:hypothetical protein
MTRTTTRVLARWALALGLGVASCTGNQPGVSAPAPTGSAPPRVTAQAAEPCPAALFCDGFEDDVAGAPPGSPWRDETGPSGASVRIDRERAYAGRQSVHVSAPRGAAYRRGYFAIHQAPVFPAASQEMYGRAMVWLEAAPIPLPGEPPVHWTFIQGEGRSADDTYNSLYRYGGERQAGRGLLANFETTPPTRSDCRQHSASTLPVQEWACVEWHFAVASNEMQFWLNGAELEDIHVQEHASGAASSCLSTEHLAGQWLAPPAFQSLFLGWERYQLTENDQDLWIDAVVIGQSRVGCPAPAPKPVAPASD